MLNQLVFLSRIVRNKFAMRGLCEPFLYKMDIAITNRCNARCRFCRIWSLKLESSQEMKLDDYERLFSNLDLSWLHLTGGEPFLRKDFHEIVTLASQNMKNLVIVDTSTNGINTKRIVSECESIIGEIKCRFEVGVSIDGIESVHDRLRGIKNSWKKALKTYYSLKSMESGMFSVHLNHVLNPVNIESFDEFLNEMRKREIPITDISFEVARNSPFFKNEEIKIEFNEAKLIETLKKIIGLQEKKRWKNIRERVRLLYLKEMLKFLQNNSRVPCVAGWVSCFIDPNGFVYPCSMMREPLANVKDVNINTILKSPAMRSWRIAHKGCKLCWSGCEGVISLIQNLSFF